jgi:hypothetical protein
MENDYSLHLEKCKALIDDPTTLIIGIDVSRLKHDACFGTIIKVIWQKFNFTNDLIGFGKFEEKINTLCLENGYKNVLISMEPTSTYWLPLYEYLISKSRIVCLLDPSAVFHNRKTLQKDKGKSDAKDAFGCYDLTKQKKFYFTTNDSFVGFSAKLLMKNWMNVQRSIISTKNRMRSFLSLVFPELESEIRDISSKKHLVLLKKYPTPTKIARLSLNDFMSEVKSETKGFKEKELIKIYELSKSSIGVSLANEANILIINKLADDLINLKEEENNWLQYCNKIAKSDAGYERAIKIKGLGDRILTGLMLSLGNYKLYSNTSQITKLAGLNLVDKTSGSSINSPSHISHKGNHHLRYWAYCGALQVIQYPGPFQDLYNKKKGKSSYRGSGKRALIAVSDKLLRVVWVILKKGGDFNPDYNIK